MNRALSFAPPPKLALYKGFKGFTLAEVLITLGIIGVVAALTLPSLITSYRQKELETRFKKTSAVIEQAVLATAHEFGMEEYILPGKKYIANMGTIPASEQNTMNDYFLSQLKYIEALSVGPSSKANSIKIYKKDGSYYTTYPIMASNNGFKAYMLQDGSSFAPMIFQHHHPSDGIKVYFDTNGPFKGPNRVGYDLFIYDTGYWCHNICSTNIGGGNFVWYGCYEYAQSDTDPDDKSKRYWKSLKF